jgi:hypothetical protein
MKPVKYRLFKQSMNYRKKLKIIDFSSRNMTLESTQPLTEMSTRNMSGGKGRPARKAD